MIIPHSIVLAITLLWINNSNTESVMESYSQQSNSAHGFTRKDGNGHVAGAAMRKDVFKDNVKIIDDKAVKNETTIDLAQETGGKGTLNLAASRRKWYLKIAFVELWPEWREKRMQLYGGQQGRSGRLRVYQPGGDNKLLYEYGHASKWQPLKKSGKWKITVKPTMNPKRPKQPKLEKPETPININGIKKLNINIYPEFHFHIGENSVLDINKKNYETLSELEKIMNNSACGSPQHIEPK